MFKRILYTVLPLASAMAFTSCDKGADDEGGEVKTAASGLEYIIHEDKEGKNIAIGDYLTLDVKIVNSTDSVLTDTKEQGSPFQFQLSESQYTGSFEEGLQFLSEGDSATFRVDVDSIFSRAQQQRPDFIEPHTKLRYMVKVKKVQTQEAFNQDMVKKQEEQVQRDQDMIAQYVTDKNLDAEQMPSGVTYVQTAEGTGAEAAAGDKISVHYTGMLLDGSKFDSSMDRGEPIEVTLGQGQVISGWDQGLVGMKEGEKGTLIIPSAMAYKQAGRPGIPKNSVLVFDVEMVKVTKAPAAQEQPAQ